MNLFAGQRWRCSQGTDLWTQWWKEKEGWIEKVTLGHIHSVQFSSVAQSCLTLCNPMNHSTPGLPVHYQLLESTQTHVHWVGDAIQPSHPLSAPSPPAFNLSQHQGLFKWVSSLHQLAKVLELQLQAGRCRAAQLESFRQMSRHVSRGSAGKYQADEQACVARLRWRV